MEAQPLISVIVPVYRAEHELCACVDSVLRQTYKNLEIILVDDGSPDRCPQICDEYAVKDSRVRVIHQKNAGASGARNRGLQSASGRYIGFVDADDWIETDLYETLYDLLQRNGADLACCGISCSGSDASKTVDTPRHPDLILTQDQALAMFFKTRYILEAPFNKLFSARLLRGPSFDPSLYLGEDALFNCECILKSRRVACISKPLYHVTCREGSLSHSHKIDERRLSEISAWEKILELLSAKDDSVQKEAEKRYLHANFVLINDNVGPVDEALNRALKRNIRKYLFADVFDPGLQMRYCMVCLSPGFANMIWRIVKKLKSI